MSDLPLRDYQRSAIDAVFKAWQDGMRRPAIVLPTGAGKTVVFAHLIREFHTKTGSVPQWGGRVIVLVHRDELADQAIDKIRAIAPGLDVGKVKAEDNDIGADVMVCSVQTLAVARRLELVKIRQGTVGPRGTRSGGRLGNVGLIITDECHHGLAPTYRKIYDAFPDALNLGVTATLQRGDGLGLGDVWDDVVYSKSILWMIGKGHLADIRMKNVDVGGLDLSEVKRQGRDFQAGDLGRALEESDMAEKLPAAYAEHAGDRPGVVFTPTVATAEDVARSFNGAGIRTAVITGETPREERQRIFEDYRTGRVQVLANCMVLTEGFDAPWASCAVIARPTQSAPLYTQMVGRVLRKYPGKSDALVLNVAGPGKRICTLIDLAPGAVHEMQEGELLTEAVVREAEAADQVVSRGSIAFDLKFRDVNAFAASSAAWLTTHAGVQFISAGQTTVFLWPGQHGLWDVCTVVKGQPWNRSEHIGLDIGSAMAWGEAVAEEHGDFSTQRSARWRKGKPSEAQQRVAEGLGLEFSQLNKGQLSDAISVTFASRVFDRFAGKVLGTRA